VRRHHAIRSRMPRATRGRQHKSHTTTETSAATVFYCLGGLCCCLTVPSRTRAAWIIPLYQVCLLSRLGTLPFALLKTAAVIPFPVLVHGVNRPTVLDGLEASCTLLVLEISGKPHTGPPRRFPLSSSAPSVHPSPRPWPVVPCFWCGLLIFNLYRTTLALSLAQGDTAR